MVNCLKPVAPERRLPTVHTDSMEVLTGSSPPPVLESDDEAFAAVLTPWALPPVPEPKDESDDDIKITMESFAITICLICICLWKFG